MLLFRFNDLSRGFESRKHTFLLFLNGRAVDKPVSIGGEDLGKAFLEAILPLEKVLLRHEGLFAADGNGESLNLVVG